MLKEFDRELNHYYTSVYLYYNEAENTAELSKYESVDRNSRLDDDHFTIYTDRRHYDSCIEDIELREVCDIKDFIRSDETLMNKVRKAYEDWLDNFESEYAEKAESLISKWEFDFDKKIESNKEAVDYAETNFGNENKPVMPQKHRKKQIEIG